MWKLAPLPFFHLLNPRKNYFVWIYKLLTSLLWFMHRKHVRVNYLHLHYLYSKPLTWLSPAFYCILLYISYFYLKLLQFGRWLDDRIELHALSAHPRAHITLNSSISWVPNVCRFFFLFTPKILKLPEI